ncbi:MAG: hypothetical protein COU69_02090 [Candidatus Pacebacteria bacterium CG10_big_fil_rev_8_21_14_0_10_56_10]|nr:MAG: hypothetical protein COU69_02090 [Candidatus Pacebacteria bacterium CG10_big_fil_rev_8_21_14_0_10_56_10]
MSSRLSLDTSFLNATTADHHGITQQTIDSTQANVESAIASVEQQLGQGRYGFVEVVTQPDEFLKQVREVFARLEWARTLVVVGIGGSDLGGRAVQQALQSDQPPLEVVFHGDSTDPEQIRRLKRRIDLSSTVFNIVSKSGQTVETISQYVLFKELLRQEEATAQNWQKHFVFTTDRQKGILRDEADREKIATLPIPDNVGGRFSVQTPVGLFPAVAMGVDIEQLVTGQREFALDSQSRALSQQLAAGQYRLYAQGTKLTVLMAYSIQLEEFARWFRQLWAESLGKDGKGILPIKAYGPADQHSQAQFYNQGEPLQSVLFVRLEQRRQDYRLGSVGIPELEYLAGHSFHQIINIEQEASALSLKKAGRPTATLSIDSLDAYSLGQLFMFFELAVVYLAEMIGVNAFDQPGVEESKQMMYALLGRQGFDDKRSEIEQLRG